MTLRLPLVVAVITTLAAPVAAQFGFSQQEAKVVARFDEDRNGRLDKAERRAARQVLGAGTGGMRGGWRMRAANVVPGPRFTPAQAKAYPAATSLYALDALRTVFLEFEGDEWEDELAAFYNTDVEVPATATIDGQVFRDVGVHFRGMSSYRMVPAGYKHSLNLSLDFVHDGQDFGSYQTLNLLNSHNDPTFVRTVIYTEIARHYIPTPKANYLRVVINGESWGVYVNAQQFNGDFVREWFKTRRGARWKVPGSPRGRGGLEYLGEDPAAYKRLYEIRTDDHPKPWTDLIALTRTLNTTPPERLEAALAPLLDVDGVLKFLALEVALVNSDGYWTRASDYNLYQDVNGRFHIVPHDVNEALGSADGRGFGGRGGAELDALVGLTDATKPLRSKLLAVPALRARYLGYVRDIAQTWMDWKTLEPMATRFQALIGADVRTDTRKLDSFEAFQTGIAGLRDFVERRRAFLLAYKGTE